jgi:transposase
MTMLADTVDAVVGIDTHSRTHTARLATATGVVLGERTVTNTSAGFAELLTWINEQRPGPRVLAAVEGTRSYGLALCQELARAGHAVVEVEQPSRKLHRNGKSDPIDAGLAIEQMLRTSVDQANIPRAGGLRDALRMLLNARTELTVQRTMQCNRLHHLLLAGDDIDRELGNAKFTVTRLASIIRRQHPADAELPACIHRSECRRIAQAVRDLGQDLTANEKQLRSLLDALAPGLLELPGVGPVSAAAVVVAFSHPGRLRDDAAFAALAGTCPIPASSGKTVRHRLNRGGDRHLNCALHTIARSRLRYDPKTRAYAERRRTEGKTDREILRCLKRYITRQLYRDLTNRMSPAA